MRLPLAFPLLALLASPLAAETGSGPFFVPERGKAFGSLQDAVLAIGNGSGTIQIAPGTYRQCAVQEAGEVVYVAREPGTVAQVIEDGYTIYDRLLRPARVAVVKRRAPSSNDSDEPPRDSTP